MRTILQLKKSANKMFSLLCQTIIGLLILLALGYNFHQLFTRVQSTTEIPKQNQFLSMFRKFKINKNESLQKSNLNQKLKQQIQRILEKITINNLQQNTNESSYLFKQCQFLTQKFVLKTKLQQKNHQILQIVLYDMQDRKKYQNVYTDYDIGKAIHRVLNLDQLFEILCPPNKIFKSEFQQNFGEYIYPPYNKYNIKIQKQGKIQFNIQWTSAIKEHSARFDIHLLKVRQLTFEEIFSYQILKLLRNKLKQESCAKQREICTKMLNQRRIFKPMSYIAAGNAKGYLERDFGGRFVQNTTIVEKFKISNSSHYSEHPVFLGVGSDAKQFSFKIVKKGSEQVYVGVMQGERNTATILISNRNVIILSNLGHFINQKKQSLMVDSEYGEGDVVTVKIDQKQNTISWFVKNKLLQKYLLTFRDQKIGWSPIFYMNNIGDMMQRVHP